MDTKILFPLIEVFGDYAASDVEDKQTRRLLAAVGARDMREIYDTPTIADLYRLVKQLKLRIESICVAFPEEGRQVIQCLRYLETERTKLPGRRPGDKDPVEVLARLIDRWFIKGNRWGAQNQQKYIELAPLVTDWVDYFLSYTNRGTPATNNDFKKAIEYVFGKKLPAYDQENYVAKIIAKYVKGQGVVGFFDEKDITAGERIQDRVEKMCRSSFSLIQFVEYESFVDPGTQIKNWCFEEYSYFSSSWKGLAKYTQEAPENYFVITPAVTNTSDLFPAQPRVEYADWLNEVRTPKAVRLANVKRQDVLRGAIKPIAERILAQRKEFMERVLYLGVT